MADRYHEAAARAWLVFQAGRFDEAAAICEEILGCLPDLALLHGVYGVISGERGDTEAAVQNLQRARLLAPANPEWPFNLGIACLRGGRFSEAKAGLLEALRLKPRSIEYLIELAILHWSLDEDRETLALCLDVVAQDPTNADAHILIAETLLRRGEMSLGWGEYARGQRLRQHRLRKTMSAAAEPQIAVPRWNGTRSTDTSVVLIFDVGFAEMIQFARYLPLIVPQYKSVALQTPRELAPLLSRIPDVAIVPTGQQPQAVNTELANVSELPGLFTATLESLPGAIPYLDADPVRVKMWRQKLSAQIPTNQLLVGLMWSSVATNQTRARHTLAFSRLAPLLSVPGVVFISLQKPVTSEDADVMRDAMVPDLSAELIDFGETAAILANLDLVISTETPTAHLAGALGRKVWVLLSRPTDWRWLRDREDSPWYPTMRLFRQQTIGEWGDPIAQAAAALAIFSVEHSTPPRVV